MRWELHVNLTDKLKRKLYIKYEFIKFILRLFIKNNSISLILRTLVQLKLSKFIRYSSRSYPHNRCVISGRSYFIINKLKLSRFNFRKNSQNLILAGYKRKSW